MFPNAKLSMHDTQAGLQKQFCTLLIIIYSLYILISTFIGIIIIVIIGYYCYLRSKLPAANDLSVSDPFTSESMNTSALSHIVKYNPAHPELCFIGQTDKSLHR